LTLPGIIAQIDTEDRPNLLFFGDPVAAFANLRTGLAAWASSFCLLPSNQREPLAPDTAARCL
jgi:hypothetical protein